MKKPNQKNVDKYKNRIRDAEEYRDSGYRELWERLYKRYRNHVDEIKDSKGKVRTDRSNISIPYSFTMIETILPRLVESLFAGRPYVTVKGKPKDIEEYRLHKDAEDTEGMKPWEASAKKMEQLLDYQQNVVFDIQNVFHIGLKTMTMYGTTVGYVGWKLEEKPIVRKEMANVLVDGEPLTENGEPVQKLQAYKSTESTYDDPELKFLDLGLFFVDPHAEDIEDARYCGHACYEPKSYIQTMNDAGIWYVDWTKVPKNSGMSNDARNRRMSNIGLPTTEGFIRDEQSSDQLYEIHYYWEDDKKVVMINRGYIAYEDENPYYHKKKPYVKDVYCKVPGEFYGIGVLETIEDLQDELNVERNQRIDNRSRALRRMYTQIRGAKIEPPDFNITNGGRILVDTHDAIKEWEHKPITGDTFTQEGIIKQDMRDTTGAQDVVMGMSGAAQTATETMTKDNNASMRFKMVISSIEKRLLVQISSMMIQLNQQFVDGPRLLEVNEKGEDLLLEVTPEEIQGLFRLMPVGSSVEPMANKEAFKQRMVELYSIVSSDHMMQEHPIKRKNLLKKVFEAFDIQDTDDLLPSDEELQGIMQDQAIQGFIATLPPELQQILMSVMGQGAPQQPMQNVQQGNGANTAMQSEQGLRVI